MISCNLNFLIQRFYIFLVFFFGGSGAGVTRGEQCDMLVHLVMLVNVIADAAHFTIVNELLLALKIHRAVVVGATGLLLLLLLHLLLLELLLLHDCCRYLLRHETFLKVDAFPHLTISEG